MNAIQIILIAGLLLVGFVMVARLRSGVFIKPLAAAFTAVGVYFVLNPDATTVIARWFGVDRGTDLMLYLFMLGTFFALTHLYARQREIKAQLTQFYREEAIRNAEKLGTDSKATIPEHEK
jgi:small membrane protein